jgi:voltage-gated potassium channel
MGQQDDLQSRALRGLEALVVIGAIATIPLTILLEEHERGAVVEIADWMVWCIFAVEFAATVWVNRRSKDLGRRAVLPLAVVVLSFPMLPAILGLVRLARLARVFRALRLVAVVSRGIGALRVILARRGVLYVSAVTLLVIIAGGGALALLEPQTVKGGFFDGVWWAIVTASTVGYGDIAPTTLYGRMIAIIMMLAGVGLISTLAASITAYFIGQTENADMADLKRRLARIDARIEEIAYLLESERRVHPERSEAGRGD